MAADWSESLNPYTILQLENGPNSTKEEIRKAYKKMALLKHPDKNKNNPKAHEEFAELRKALDVLEDKDARAALDDLIKARAARDAQLSQQDAKRQKMRQDLERREQQAFSEKSELEVAKARLVEELQRLRKKAQEQEKQKMAAAAQAWAAGKAAAAAAANAGEDSEIQETLQRSLKVSWTLTDGDYSEQQLWEVFKQHGPVESVNKLEKKKRKQTASALVVMGSVAAAQSAVHSVCGDVKNPLLVLPAKKASTTPDVPKPPTSSSPWPPYSPPGSTHTSTSYAAQPPVKPLFPGGASAPSNGSSKPAFQATSASSFASFEAAILARMRQHGQQQKEAQQAAKEREAPGDTPSGQAVQEAVQAGGTTPAQDSAQATGKGEGESRPFGEAQASNGLHQAGGQDKGVETVDGNESVAGGPGQGGEQVGSAGVVNTQ